MHGAYAPVLPNSIISTIPNKWKEVIKLKNPPAQQTEIFTPDCDNAPYVKFFNKLKPITMVSSKDIYKELIIKKVQPPTAINKWIETYPFLETINWRDIFTTPFKVVTEPYLQSFQYIRDPK